MVALLRSLFVRRRGNLGAGLPPAPAVPVMPLRSHVQVVELSASASANEIQRAIQELDDASGLALVVPLGDRLLLISRRLAAD